MTVKDRPRCLFRQFANARVRARGGALRSRSPRFYERGERDVSARAANPVEEDGSRRGAAVGVPVSDGWSRLEAVQRGGFASERDAAELWSARWSGCGGSGESRDR